MQQKHLSVGVQHSSIGVATREGQHFPVKVIIYRIRNTYSIYVICFLVFFLIFLVGNSLFAGREIGGYAEETGRVEGSTENSLVITCFISPSLPLLEVYVHRCYDRATNEPILFNINIYESVMFTKLSQLSTKWLEIHEMVDPYQDSFWALRCYHMPAQHFP